MLSRHLPFLLRHQAMASLQGVACRFSSGTASVADADETRRWVFLGPPGVGKGTYASRIAKQLGLAHIATGDLIRQEIKTKTPMGLQVSAHVMPKRTRSEHAQVPPFCRGALL
jgi:adenylate kinase